MEENQVTEGTLIEKNVLLIAQSTAGLYEQYFDITHTEDWKDWTVQEQILFRNVVEQFFLAAAIIREKFDGDVWKGHSNGTVDPTVTSVRKQREGDTPGKKAEPVTASSLLAKRLKK